MPKLDAILSQFRSFSIPKSYLPEIHFVPCIHFFPVLPNSLFVPLRFPHKTVMTFFFGVSRHPPSFSLCSLHALYLVIWYPTPCLESTIQRENSRRCCLYTAPPRTAGKARGINTYHLPVQFSVTNGNKQVWRNILQSFIQSHAFTEASHKF